MVDDSNNASETQETETFIMSDSVPIFLKKTYYMIDSCDTTIAGWDEDGLTFTVKDPNHFENKIIPQFFKHSKFSSFVRQLNFYSFRKIKYGDSIRIDVETEKKTSNYWRFKHENFRRGRPDLLTEIKRMNGKTVATGVTNTTPPFIASNSIVPDAGSFSSSSDVKKISTVPIQAAEKSEVLKLKKRIDEMTKSIDKLTEMVKKVTLQQSEGENISSEPETKRKKAIQKLNSFEDANHVIDLPMPDEAFSSSTAMDIEDLLTLQASPEPSLSVPTSNHDFVPQVLPPQSVPLSRESSTDSEFVDQLFTAFNEDDNVADWLMSHDAEYNASDDIDAFFLNHTNNRPDPLLMQRLSDALQLLPRDIQEMIVNRLIEAITSTDGVSLPMDNDAVASSMTPIVSPVTSKTVAAPSQLEPKKVATASKSLPQQQGLPLAAATLAALLHHYSSQIKDVSSSTTSSQVSTASKNEPLRQSEGKKNMKTLPVIPVHA